MKPVGCVRLNASEDSVPPDATIIVSGPPRSGTSLAAAALHAAGLWLGDNMDHAVFEDMEFAGPVEPKVALSLRVGAAMRHRGQWRAALRGLDVDALKHLVAARNARFTKWGFKRPNMVPLLGSDRGLTLFRQPRLVLVFRDPVAFAERISIAEGMRFHNALYYARRYVSANLWAARHTNVPTLLVSYEKANAHREVFFDQLFGFCGLAIAREAYADIDAFIDTAGKEYLRLAAGPNRGYIDGYREGVLLGWCRTPGRSAPERVEIYADGVKVASVCADEFSADLHKAGFGDGRHRFSVPLDHLALPDACRVRAVIAGTNVDIENSGLSLGELRARLCPPVRA